MACRSPRTDEAGRQRPVLNRVLDGFFVMVSLVGTARFQQRDPAVQATVIVCRHDQTIEDNLFKPCQRINLRTALNRFLYHSGLAWYFSLSKWVPRLVTPLSVPAARFRFPDRPPPPPDRWRSYPLRSARAAPAGRCTGRWCRPWPRAARPRWIWATI